MMYNKNTEEDHTLYLIGLEERKKQTTDRRTWLQKCRDYQQQRIDLFKLNKQRKEYRYREWLKHPTRKGEPIKLPTFKSMRIIIRQISIVTMIVDVLCYAIMMFATKYPWQSNPISIYILLFSWIFTGSAMLLVVCIDYAAYKRSKGKHSLFFKNIAIYP